MNRNRSPLVITAGILFALGAILVYFSGFYIDWLWFNSVDFTSVWTTVLATKISTLFNCWLTYLFSYLAQYLYRVQAPPAVRSNKYRDQWR